ncbi:HXXEE domain-containing protein [Streptomyces sp. Tue6028]|uniref:HXXEE domain-containing protein n=1 Tax=Streptomyces sp. Tue6028 TaxID=2036037 RepID=UPI003EBC7AAC
MRTETTAPAPVPPTVTWGLLAAWMLNDAEELATTARFSGMPQRRVGVAIGLMGCVVTAASAAGARTGGRSRFFRTAVTAFGLHGVTHLASAAVLGRYTPGVATAPTVVIPYALWAARRMRAAGVPLTDGEVRGTVLRGLGLAAVTTATVQGIAWLATRDGRGRHAD